VIDQAVLYKYFFLEEKNSPGSEFVLAGVAGFALAKALACRYRALSAPPFTSVNRYDRQKSTVDHLTLSFKSCRKEPKRTHQTMRSRWLGWQDFFLRCSGKTYFTLFLPFSPHRSTAKIDRNQLSIFLRSWFSSPVKYRKSSRQTP